MTKQTGISTDVLPAPEGWEGDRPPNLADGEHSVRNFDEELCHNVFEYVAVGIALGAPNGRWLRVNKRFRDITGYEADRLVNSHFQDITHPDDVEEDNELLRELYLLKIPSFTREKRYIHRNGSRVWVNVTTSLVPDGGGAPCHISIVEDITRRHLAESALRQSERSLRSERRIALLGNWTWNFARGEFFWSARIRHIFGQIPSSPESCLKQAHPDDQLLLKNALDSALKGKSLNVEFRIFGPNSDVRYVHMQGEPIFDVQGIPLKIVGTVQDITDHRLAAGLHENSVQQEDVSPNIPGMVFQLRQSEDALAFTYVSDGSNEVCGFTADRVITSPFTFLELLHPEDREAFHHSRIRSREDLSIWNWEGRLELAGKRIKWINLRAAPRRIGAIETVWDGIILNISQSKEDEEEIKRSREMLRALSAHLMAAKEDEVKRIAREIHDELGQRLTVLRMDLATLPKLFAEPCTPLLETTDRMKDTVDGILRIARDISSHLRPAVLDMGLVMAVEWLLDGFRTSLRIPISFRNRLGDDIVLGEEQTTNIFRILQESLTNVARHANARHVEVALEIVDTHLHLRVKDDGSGFESQQRDAKNTFGLRGMRERAIALGGEISILSAPEDGTTIFVSIPLLKER